MGRPGLALAPPPASEGRGCRTGVIPTQCCPSVLPLPLPQGPRWGKTGLGSPGTTKLLSAMLGLRLPDPEWGCSCN